MKARNITDKNPTSFNWIKTLLCIILSIIIGISFYYLVPTSPIFFMLLLVAMPFVFGYVTGNYIWGMVASAIMIGTASIFIGIMTENIAAGTAFIPFLFMAIPIALFGTFFERKLAARKALSPEERARRHAEAEARKKAEVEEKAHLKAEQGAQKKAAEDATRRIAEEARMKKLQDIILVSNRVSVQRIA